MQTVDVILPCYNPSLHWEQNVISKFNKLQHAVSELNVNLIIVNDGSPNWETKTEEVLIKNISTVHIIHHETNQGKGESVRTGARNSHSHLMLFTDIDFPYKIESMVDVLNSVRKNSFDIAFATRSTTYYSQVPYIRRLISKSLKAMVRLVLRLPFTDTQGGLKAFNKDGKKQLLLTSTKGYLFDLELLKLAHKNNLKISQVTSQLREDVKFTQMKFRILLREGFNFLKIIFKH